MATWFIRGGQQGESIEDFLNSSSVGVGLWSGENDLSLLGKSEIKAIILQNYPKEPTTEPS